MKTINEIKKEIIEKEGIKTLAYKWATIDSIVLSIQTLAFIVKNIGYILKIYYNMYEVSNKDCLFKQIKQLNELLRKEFENYSVINLSRLAKINKKDLIAFLDNKKDLKYEQLLKLVDLTDYEITLLFKKI